MEITKTYTRIINKDQNSLLWKMSCESAKVYNAYLNHYKTNTDFEYCRLETNKQIKRQYLQSQSYQGSQEEAKESIMSFFQANKKYKTNKSGFSGCPQFPRPDKRIQVIIFKKKAIHYKDGYLLLSTIFKHNPIKIKWNIEEVGMPVFATIKMDYTDRQWHLSCVFKEEQPNLITGTETLSIDLGIKRIATTFDGKNVTTYNGKLLMELVQLDNKKRSEVNQIKEQRKKKYSRTQKRKLNGLKKQITKIKNKKKDILHKYSRFIVNKSIKTGIAEIVVGDCRGIHIGTNTGKVNNQKIQQGQEQKLAKMIEYKFKRVGGKVSLIDESYSTQTCPVCGNRYKPKDRIYLCSNCGFRYDRDGVGSINIYSKKVSHFSVRSGDLTSPSGVKFIPQLSYKLVCSEDRSSGCTVPIRKLLPEPHEFLFVVGCQV